MHVIDVNRRQELFLFNVKHPVDLLLHPGVLLADVIKITIETNRIPFLGNSTESIQIGINLKHSILHKKHFPYYYKID